MTAIPKELDNFSAEQVADDLSVSTLYLSNIDTIKTPKIIVGKWLSFHVKLMTCSVITLTHL